ncbi:dephospho-CoA kinase [Brachybacterium sp. JHP9]|uniref:Dephospho-CoA kinase n=1 Tax=Brachybacterium equifaecis TaxID=2910770 RepID=A0ABT0R0E7_9MICO|nr:dephospho-CoA kinase [Brachybacterium equifaecis]MCL6423389.1 dephospho-CoA kinase [Brachybacterium equifaecis]
MHISRIGLTGGIGSGKSTVAQLWRDRGARVIDLDAHSRAVLDLPGPGVEEAIARFGEQYRAEDGTVARTELARLVFADPAARADLEAIVLGRVEEAVRREEEQMVCEGADLLVHDSPLLLEKAQDRTGRYAEVVVVLARREDRIERIARNRGRDRAYAESVMSAQVTDLERIRRASRILLNTGDQELLARRAGRLLESLR